MKMSLIFLAALTATTLLAANLAKADAFDDKAHADEAQQEQIAEAKARAAKIKQLLSDNASILRRIPRGASITECFNESAAIWRNERNGCNLENIQWNGVPVQICSEGYDPSFPPDIVSCHYHVNSSGLDCQIFLNSSIKPRCL